MKILIDNGLGENTPGKRSPDGRFLEFQFNRTIAKQIVDDLAEQLAKAAIKNLPQMKMRAEKSDGDMDYEENFYILRHTLCPAVLVENFFYDNPDDLRFLESEEGQARIVEALMKGVGRYVSM